MNETPIIFSAPMVRAILDGRKTQTRRVAKPQPSSEQVNECILRCPYGAPGDRLWVRESGWERPVRTPKMMREGADTWAPYYFDADGLTESDLDDIRRWGFKRCVSRFMPRSASRITLEIEAVRVEKLNEITEDDAKAEGIEWFDGRPGRPVNHHGWRYEPGSLLWVTATGAFRELWESLHGSRSWDANPWVWVIQFRKVE